MVFMVFMGDLLWCIFVFAKGKIITRLMFFMFFIRGIRLWPMLLLNVLRKFLFHLPSNIIWVSLFRFNCMLFLVSWLIIFYFLVAISIILLLLVGIMGIWRRVIIHFLLVLHSWTHILFKNIPCWLISVISIKVLMLMFVLRWFLIVNPLAIWHNFRLLLYINILRRISSIRFMMLMMIMMLVNLLRLL